MKNRKLPTLKEFFLKEDRQEAVEKARYRQANDLTRSCQTCGYFNYQKNGYCDLFDFDANEKYTCDDWISSAELLSEK